MSDRSPEIDCNHDNLTQNIYFVGKVYEYAYRRCVDCGQWFKAVQTSQDGFDWVEVGEPKEKP